MLFSVPCHHERRFSGGLDKEKQASEAAQMTEEEKQKLRRVFIVYQKELAAELDVAGNVTGERDIIFEKMGPLPEGHKPPLLILKMADNEKRKRRRSSRKGSTRGSR